ncbi:hypothetical protein [Nostoc sp. FACHB-280]|nr:hypothetical protein [Nostoc sp. FACHB-280]
MELTYLLSNISPPVSLLVIACWGRPSFPLSDNLSAIATVDERV